MASRIEAANKTTDSEGRNIFKDGPPGTTVPAAWLTNVQEEICRAVESQGIAIQSQGSDTKDGLTQAIARRDIYDYVVNSQAEFNAMIESTGGANEYQIKDEYKSIYISAITGGYLCSGPISFLEGAETWGYIQTNNCEIIFAEPGGYFNFGNARGYIDVTTESAALYNVEVRGAGTNTNTVTQSFCLNAEKVLFQNCKTTQRYSTTNFVGFQGGTSDQNRTTKYLGCLIQNCDTNNGTMTGFSSCWNMSSCQVYDLESSGICIGMLACNYLAGIIIEKLNSTASFTYGIERCNRLNAFQIKELDSVSGTIGIRGLSGTGSLYISAGSIQDLDCTSGDVHGIKGAAAGLTACYNISAVIILALGKGASGGDVYGCQYAERLSAISIYDLEVKSVGGSVYGMHSCTEIGSSLILQLNKSHNSAGTVEGMNACTQVSSCRIETLDTSGTGDLCGIIDSNNISSIKISDLDTVSCDLYGLKNCDCVTGFTIDDLENSGSGNNETRALSNCDNVSGGIISNFTYSGGGADIVKVVDSSNCISNVQIKTVISDSSNTLVIYSNCSYISGCYVTGLTHSSGTAIAFNSCGRMTSCGVFTFTQNGNYALTGFSGCSRMSACFAQSLIGNGNQTVYGFASCTKISASEAFSISADSGDARGFSSCSTFSACEADSITSSSGVANGFNGCTYGSALTSDAALNASNNWIDSGDTQISDNYSTGDIFT
jgi:hypothetical protein